MRFLLPDEIESALNRGKSVENYLGPGKTPCSISWVEIRPTQNQFEVWFFEVEDIGNSNYTDVYTFPDTGYSSEEPVVLAQTPGLAVEQAGRLFGAASSQWLNQSVFHNLYASTKQ